MPKPSRATLPCGRVIRCLQPHDVPVMVAEVGDYFRYGIDVRPGDTVLDVGANIGLFAMSVFDRLDGDVDLHALEPLPRTHGVLAHNLGEHTSDRVRVHQLGLGRTTERVSFAFFPSAPILSTAHPKPSKDLADVKRATVHRLSHSPDAPKAIRWLRHLPGWMAERVLHYPLRWALRRREVDCDLQSFGDFVRAEKIETVDLLKLDVERSELEILRGLVDADWARVRQLVVEIHDEDGGLASVREILAANDFEELGFERSAILDDVCTIWARRRGAA